MYAHSPSLKSKPVVGHKPMIRRELGLPLALRFQIVGEGYPETCTVPADCAAVELGTDVVGCCAGREPDKGKEEDERLSVCM